VSRVSRIFATTTFRLGGSVARLFVFVFLNTSVFAERQVEAAIEAEVQGLQETYEREGVPGLAQAIQRRIDPNIRTDGVYILTDSNRRRIAGNLLAWPQDTQADDLWVSFSIIDMRRAEPSSADVRALQFIVPGGYRLLVGRDIRDARDFRNQLARSLNIGIGLTVALGLIGGLLFSRSMMGRVERITQTCRRIVRGDLSQRIPGAGQSDELGRLSASVNDMLDQIERLMKGMREVSDNVAHDLRTPLNRLRVRLEAALNRATDAEERAQLEEAIADADALLATFSSLLRIARAEAQVRQTFAVVNLSDVAFETADLYEALAEDKGVEFQADIAPDILGWGDAHLLAQAFANVLDNAVKYTPAGGKVSLSLGRDGEGAALTVADSGPGIPPEYRDKVFERMYRLDSSRSTAGSGLGLSLVSAVAVSHDLKIELSDNDPGLIVRIGCPGPPI
jgi:signal transduction histidine kinase